MSLTDNTSLASLGQMAARRISVAIVGGGDRAAILVRLLNDVENVLISAVCSSHDTAPAARLAKDLGIYITNDLADVFQVPELDLIIDLTSDPRARAQLELQRPSSIAVITGPGAEFVWDLLVAKKRGEEHERLFVELQVAYDKIRSHERRLEASKTAMEEANEKLEARLAEIFFTHEFFKALTSFTLVDDVCSLIVDGCNGILGAEISCVYLFNRDDWQLYLRASQGRPESAFRHSVSVAETILGYAFREGPLQEADIDHAGSNFAEWLLDPTEAVSQAAMPLRAGDNVFGVMVIASANHRELSPAEMERFQVLGNQASLSLQNALLHEELERLSVTDRLTELYNHGYFQQRLVEEVNRAVRFGHPLSLIMLDIDDFKDFNDSWGHPRGDDVLRSVSSVIKANLRDMDIAARYGGEEFAVVLPETGMEGAAAVAERIRSDIARLRFTPNGVGPVSKTVSVGVACYPEQGATALRLLEAADRAMYEAKHAGKDRVHRATL